MSKKLTDEELRAIKTSTLSLIKIAERYGITTRVAREIRTDSRWWAERNHGE